MKTTMPAPLALYLANAMLAAVSPDTMTPVITGIHLERDGKKLRATATDRYRVHQVTLADAKTTGKADEHHIIPAATLKWLKRTLPIVAPRRIDRDGATVTITAHASQHVEVTITTAADDIATFGTATISGNYPPLHRLFDLAEKAERWTEDVAYRPDLLGGLDALVIERGLGSQPRLKQTAAEAHPGDKPTEPGPVLATLSTDTVTARALVQPNMILR